MSLVVDPDSKILHSICFQVDIDPWSAQAMKTGRVQIREAVNAELARRVDLVRQPHFGDLGWSEVVSDPC